jgi:hypothetical protein
MERKMRSTILAALVPLLLLGSVVSVVAAELKPEEVQNAMRKGVAYLKTEWQDHGKWSDYGGQDGGITCLCTMALLNAGEPLDDQHAYLKNAMDRVRNLRPTTTYVVALQTMVLCRAGQLERDQDIIARNVEWLQNGQITAGFADRRGGWSYGESAIGPKGTPQGDGSNSQFALLALYEAARAAEKQHLPIKINREMWEHARNYWIYNQVDNGGWGYYKGMEPTGSMTCAGISSLVICSDMLHEPDAKVNGDSIDGCARASSEDRDRINKGIDWLRRYFTVQANPPSAGGNVRLWHYYYLYGLERAGRLSARRKIGEHDWYREGAYHLVHTINADILNSSWRGSGFAETDPDITTSLALLFLSKGRWPALMAKVEFGRTDAGRIRDADKHWNWHRNDVNNLTINTESHWGFEMTWQEIDINKANVDELLQVPVLFFSGNGSPLPDGDEQRKRLAENLRDYIDRGGFIFADGGEACADGDGAAEFDKGFRQLMDLVFQKPEYRFKELDASHPVWRADEQVAYDQVRLLLGIDYGCRTSVIYAPVDREHPRPSLASLWDLSRSGQRETYSKSVQDQIKGGLTIGRNVLTYATNRELKGREYSFQNNLTKVVPDKERGKFAVAKLLHPGGCDAAPRALANLMEQAATDLHIRVEAHPQLIGMTDPALLDYAVVFMHGRNAFRLTDNERQALRKFIENGGVLFADAICGSEPFAESFRNEMGIIFPKNPLMSIPANDPIWTTKYGGNDLSLVTRRDPQPGDRGAGLKSALRRVPPEFKAVRIGDRYGVIFSEFDLSCALEKHDSLECRGYTREDAARLGLNVILYAMQK